MKHIKEIIFIIAMAIFGFVCAYYGIKASDNTMTDSEIEYYLEQYPNDKDLNELAIKRHLR